MDATKAKGFWLLPADDPAKLRRFFDTAATSHMTTAGLVLVHQDLLYGPDKSDWTDISLPEGWSYMSTGATLARFQIHETMKMIKLRDWIGIITTEHMPQTPDWDKALINAAQSWQFATPDDNDRAPSFVGDCIVFGGDLVRTLPHTDPYDSEAWQTIGAATGAWVTRMDVIVSRSTPRKQRKAIAPEDVAGEIDAVDALKTSLGVVHRTVDVSNISVMICTPSGDAKFCMDYVTSLARSFRWLEERQIPYKWVVEGGNSDIVAARQELLAVFWHSEYSHILFIDADMGWEPEAIARLLLAGKDFVAVAGRKKRDAVIFALNPLGTEGGASSVPVNMQSGVAEIREIGMAFTLLSRECVRAVIEAHPELEYDTTGDHARYAVFSPITENRRYRAEDYAFCYRWRATGGQVYVCPDVSIKHIGGMQVYEGCWSDTWQSAPAATELREAAE